MRGAIFSTAHIRYALVYEALNSRHFYRTSTVTVTVMTQVFARVPLGMEFSIKINVRFFSLLSRNLELESTGELHVVHKRNIDLASLVTVPAIVELESSNVDLDLSSGSVFTPFRP
jgi:hypothetical protein